MKEIEVLGDAERSAYLAFKNHESKYNCMHSADEIVHFHDLEINIDPEALLELERKLNSECPEYAEFFSGDANSVIEKLLRAGTELPSHLAVEDFGPSKHTTIRLPSEVLAALRREAVRRAMPYQRLINETLRAASSSW